MVNITQVVDRGVLFPLFLKVELFMLITADLNWFVPLTNVIVNSIDHHWCFLFLPQPLNVTRPQIGPSSANSLWCHSAWGNVGPSLLRQRWQKFVTKPPQIVIVSVQLDATRCHASGASTPLERNHKTFDSPNPQTCCNQRILYGSFWSCVLLRFNCDFQVGKREKNFNVAPGRSCFHNFEVQFRTSLEIYRLLTTFTKLVVDPTPDAKNRRHASSPMTTRGRGGTILINKLFWTL